MSDTRDAGADRRAAQLHAWAEGVLGKSPTGLTRASADASFRRYFRIHYSGGTVIAVDAPPEQEDSRPFVALAGYFRSLDVHVPIVLEADLERGFLLLTDLGDTHYLAAVEQGADPEPLYDAALEALARIAAAPPPRGLLPPYDRQRLLSELRLFDQWFLPACRDYVPAPEDAGILERAYDALITPALEQPQVVVHRDYHSRNLQVLPEATPGILDFQDAVIGPVTYDPVSLLKDCYIRWSDERIETWLDSYRRRLASMRPDLLGDVPPERFREWFDAMGLQRHLKVLGIFTRLHQRDGKPGYLADIPRVLDHVRTAAARMPACHELLGLIERAVAGRESGPGCQA